MAETLYATSHLAGDFPNAANAVGNTPTTWAGDLNSNTNYTSRWALDDPSLGLTGTQTINVLARKGSNSGTPTIAINLYENGVLVQSVAAATNVTSTTGQTVTGTFSAGAISNAANVEIEVVQTSAGGNPSMRNSAQIAYIEWVAETSGAATVSPGVVAAAAAVPTPTIDSGGGGSATPGYIENLGTNLTFIECPDSDLADPAGDLEVIVLVELDTWLPTSWAPLTTKHDGTGDLGYLYQLRPSGSNHFERLEVYNAANSIVVNQNSNFNDKAPPSPSAPRWFRAVLDVDDGAGNHVISWYYSDDDPSTAIGSITWTAIGVDTVAGTITSFPDTTASTKLMGTTFSSNQAEGAGKLYCASIRYGGTEVADPDFRTADQTSDSGATFVDSYGNTWTNPYTWVEPVGGGGAATVTPGAVAAVGTVPTPGLAVPATTTPNAAELAATVPTPTGTAPTAVTPNPAASTVAIDAPSPSGAAVAAPAATPAVAAIPGPSPSVPAAATPGEVPAIVTVPAPTTTAPAGASPAAIPAAVTVGTPVPTAPAAATPGTVVMVMTIPTPTVAAPSGAAPDPVDATSTIPTPTVAAAAAVTVTAVAVPATVPDPTVAAGAVGTATPDPVDTTTTVPQPAVEGQAATSPATVATTVTIPTGVLEAAAMVGPTVVAAVAAVLTPDAAADTVAVTPGQVEAVAAIPQPALTVPASAGPLAVAAVLAVDTPTIEAASAGQASPATISATATVAGPTATGEAAASPDPAVLFVAVYRPSILGQLVALTHRQACRFFRNTDDTRLALMPLGRSQARGLRTADWEACSAIFVLNAGDEDTVMAEMAAVWAANQAADQATLTAAIDARLQSLGYRGVGGADLT